VPRINANETPTFEIFRHAHGAVPVEPAGDGIFVRFKEPQRSAVPSAARRSALCKMAEWDAVRRTYG